ncbi:MAG: hypothetical protein R2857_04815 [Vampirovibrionales bacterium]
MAFSPPNKSGRGRAGSGRMRIFIAWPWPARAADARIAVSDLEACLPTSYTIATLRAPFPGSMISFDPHRIAFLAGLIPIGHWGSGKRPPC